MGEKRLQTPRTAGNEDGGGSLKVHDPQDEEHCSQKFAEGTIEVEFSIKIEMNTDSVYPSGAEQSSCKISGCGNK